jgi:hypothetical protein
MSWEISMDGGLSETKMSKAENKTFDILSKI